VSCQRSSEKIRALLHGAKRAGTDTRVAAEPQEQIAHEHGAACESAMCALILGQIAGQHCVGEHKGLAERHAESIPGDGVHAA
jgi:hypothetical protein